MADEKTTTTETPESARPETPTPTVEELTKQVEALTAAMNKQKKAIDSASADAAEWKRKYRSTLDEATAKEEARKEAEAEKDRTIAALQRDRTVSVHKASYLSMGYTEEQATAAAEALADGDAEKVKSLQKEFLNTYTDGVKKALLNQQPSVTPGQTPTGNTFENSFMAAFRRGAGLKD